MKKILGLVLVLFFVFSFLSATVATAGPAYEKLKKENRFLIKLVSGQMDDDEHLGYLKKFMDEHGETRANVFGPDPDFRMIITKAEHIFSDESFRKTIRKYPGRYLRKIVGLFLRAMEGQDHPRFFYVSSDLVKSDLISKGFDEWYEINKHYDDDNSLK